MYTYTFPCITNSRYIRLGRGAIRHSPTMLFCMARQVPSNKQLTVVIRKTQAQILTQSLPNASSLIQVSHSPVSEFPYL